MRKRTLCFAAAITIAGAGPSPAEPWRLTREVLEDKVRGGWAGQIIGVSYGGPTEFQALGKTIEGEIAWSPERVASAIHQDDLYVEMTFAEVMDRVGLDATTRQYGEMFRDSKYALWHANASARRNLNRGIEAPWSGHPRYNAHADDIDFQIEADFIGLMAPGLPRSANLYADRVGRVMNFGDGLYGGMFVAGMYAAAFFETDPRRVVEQGLLSIPAQSRYARLIADVLAWSARHPDDWRATWRLIQEKWDRDDACPDGALRPFNIDAKLNGAYVVLGLLYGGGDFAKTLEVSTRAGQDSDCNPSSAAGVLGVMLGYEAIPEAWRSGIPAMGGERFEYTRYSFEEIVASTLARAEKLILDAGGRVDADAVEIPRQSPQAPPLEQWDPGPVTRRAGFEDGSWTWEGGWRVETVRNPWASWPVKAAAGPGDEAGFAFEGTGVTIVGHYSQRGGRADVYLDGAPAGTIDAWIPERTSDNDYWHMTGLAPGEHQVRIVVRGDRDPRSNGNEVQIELAVVFGASTGRGSPPEEWTADEFPEFIRRITHFGQRADWSHDGERILFMERTYGDVYEIELGAGVIRPMTHHYKHAGYTRALYLSNGDILLSGSRSYDPARHSDARQRTAELWYLSRELEGPPVPLGERCSEGPAVSRSRMRIAWAVDHDNYPDRIPEGVSQIWVADVDVSGERPRLARQRLVLDDRDLGFEADLETQNFVPPEERWLTLSAYGYQGTEVMGLDLESGEVVNYSKSPDRYDEPEGIYPDGAHTLVECDRHSGKGSGHVDLWKLALDGSGRYERITWFSDGGRFKASNPVVSDDGRWIAFQVPRVGLAAGVGEGLYVLDLEAAGLR